MNQLFCLFRSLGESNRYVHQKETAPEDKRREVRTTKELAAEVGKAPKENPDPYERIQEKPGYTQVTGTTLILGDEDSAGLRMGIDRDKEGKVELGAGRIWCCHRKEIAAKGQKASGFAQEIAGKMGTNIDTYSNAMLQIGKYDLLAGRSAEEIFKDILKVWQLCDKYRMKVYACTIPPIEGEDDGLKKRRLDLNKLIQESSETDQFVFRVIDLEKSMANLGTNDKDVYVEGKHRKAVAETDKDKMTVAYLEALMGGGRDSLKVDVSSTIFANPPHNTSYVALGDSYAKANEQYLQGAGDKKKPGYYVETPTVDPISKKPIEKAPGDSTKKMADKLDTEVIPMLTKIEGYRCTVIQAGAEDIMRPLVSTREMERTEDSIIGSLKRMYKRCLESEPPVMVVACTLPPMTKYIEEAYPGEENREERERHYELWKRINEFIIKETARLNHNPQDRYKRVMCVRIHDLVGTQKGYIRNKYLSQGEISAEGRKAIATQIHHAINQMQVGIEFGKVFSTRPKFDKKGEPVRNKKGKIVYETSWRGPDEFLDEGPETKWREVANLKELEMSIGKTIHP